MFIIKKRPFNNDDDDDDDDYNFWKKLYKRKKSDLKDEYEACDEHNEYNAYNDYDEFELNDSNMPKIRNKKIEFLMDFGAIARNVVYSAN